MYKHSKIFSFKYFEPINCQIARKLHTNKVAKWPEISNMNLQTLFSFKI